MRLFATWLGAWGWIVLTQAASPGGPVWSDDFDRADLGAGWAVTREADFKDYAADIAGGRLRLRADTIGTDDSTVKYLGVRSIREFRFDDDAMLSVDLDWNGQANGSYLTAGLVLGPEARDGNPLEGADWLKVEYVGVPPGRNGRIVVALRTGGREQSLYAEGWPLANREGRPIGLQRIGVRIRDGGFEVFENGRSIYVSEPDAIGFAAAHVYLQMSSHSNYTAREVFFDDVRVSGLGWVARSTGSN